MTVTPEVKKWVEDQLKAGYAKEDLKLALRNQGWSLEDIAQLFPIETAAPRRLDFSKPEPVQPQEQVLATQEFILPDDTGKLEDDSILLASEAELPDTQINANDVVSEPSQPGYASTSSQEPKKQFPVVPILLLVLIVLGYWFFVAGNPIPFIGGSAVSADSFSASIADNFDNENTVWSMNSVSFKSGDVIDADEIKSVDLMFFCEDTIATDTNTYCAEEFNAVPFPSDYFNCRSSRIKVLDDYEDDVVFCCDEDGDCIAGLYSSKSAFGSSDKKKELTATPKPDKEEEPTVTPEPSEEEPTATPEPSEEEPLPEPFEEPNATSEPLLEAACLPVGMPFEIMLVAIVNDTREPVEGCTVSITEGSVDVNGSIVSIESDCLSEDAQLSVECEGLDNYTARMADVLAEVEENYGELLISQ